MDDTNTTTDRRAEDPHRYLDLLTDVDPDVRLRAATELGRLRAAEAAPALVERLGLEREFLVRETLTWAVLRVEDDARPFLYRALASPRWLARRQAAHVLSKAGRRGDAARLIPLITDESDAVASRAYAAAAATGDLSVVPALVGQLARGDSEHRATLTSSLAELGQAAVPALVEALRGHLRAEARRQAADTLALLGSPGADRAALPLTEALADLDGRVRAAALNALGQLRIPSAALTVERLTRSDDPALRQLASRLAARPPAPPAARAGQPAGSARQRRVPAPSAPAPVPHGSVEGTVAAAPGVLVELRCESTLVSHGPTFRSLAQRLADLAAEHPGADAEELLRLGPDDSTPAEAIRELTAVSGEAIELGQVVRLPGRTACYLHATAAGLPPRVGGLVSYEGGRGTEHLAENLALQVAMSSPRYLDRSGIPDAVLASVRADAEARARTGGTPEALVPRVAAGLVEQFIHGTTLLEQVSAADPGRTVNDLLYGTGVHVIGFVRLEVDSRQCPGRQGAGQR